MANNLTCKTQKIHTEKYRKYEAVTLGFFWEDSCVLTSTRVSCNNDKPSVTSEPRGAGRRRRESKTRFIYVHFSFFLHFSSPSIRTAVAPATSLSGSLNLTPASLESAYRWETEHLVHLEMAVDFLTGTITYSNTPTQTQNRGLLHALHAHLH